MQKTRNYSSSPQDTYNLGFDLAQNIKVPLLIGVDGELGSGKTVFTKGFANALGIKDLITSPTFLGVSEYYSGNFPFIHMDFYKKVTDRGIISSFLEKNCVVLIEWTLNFKKVFNEELPLDISVYIQYVKDKKGDIDLNKREICYTVKSNGS